jgi:hypothetical protein
MNEWLRKVEEMKKLRGTEGASQAVDIPPSSPILTKNSESNQVASAPNSTTPNSSNSITNSSVSLTNVSSPGSNGTKVNPFLKSSNSTKTLASEASTPPSALTTNTNYNQNNGASSNSKTTTTQAASPTIPAANSKVDLFLAKSKTSVSSGNLQGTLRSTKTSESAATSGEEVGSTIYKVKLEAEVILWKKA